MRNILSLIIMCLIFFTFIGCSDNIKPVYILPAVRLNNKNYTITTNKVPNIDIDKKIDIIKKIVKKCPTENCEATNATVQTEINKYHEVNSYLKVGTKVYKIRNERTTEAVAVKFNDEYFKAVILSRKH